MLYEFEGRSPEIGKDSFVFDNATIIGNVKIGEGCYIGAGAVLRGDYGRIEIGDFSAIEDNCVVHARPDDLCRVGSHVTVGHAAVLHNCELSDWAVIGMRAVVADFAKVGVWSVVAEGAVVKNSDVLEDETIYVGVPAKARGKITEEYKKQWAHFKGVYNELAQRRYPQSLKKLKTYPSSG